MSKQQNILNRGHA